MAAFFQSVTPRTAGFDTVLQSSLTVSSKMLTLLWMLIGGASGSTAGGIKVNTFFIITLLAVRGADERGEVTAFRRKIPSKTVDNAVIFTMKALMLLFMVAFLLTITERFFAARESRFLEYVFETFSAFGTVGLSLGITPFLSVPGKLLIIATMFMGRVGLLGPGHSERAPHPRACAGLPGRGGHGRLMKQFAIIGLSKFGQRMLEELADTGCELILIDKDRQRVDQYKDQAAAVYVADALNEDVLEKLVPKGIDAAIVDPGTSPRSRSWSPTTSRRWVSGRSSPRRTATSRRRS